MEGGGGKRVAYYLATPAKEVLLLSESDDG